MIPEQPNKALTGTKPTGFINLREAWLELFQRLAVAAGWSSLKGDERLQHTGELQDEARAEAIYGFRQDSLRIIESSIRRLPGAPNLTIWTRQFPHQELEMIDLHRIKGWSEYSIASGDFVGPKNYQGEASFWGWPLFIREKDWAKFLAEMAPAGVQSKARPAPPLAEAELNRWLERFCADPANADVTQVEAWRRIQKKYSKHSIGRDRVIERLRELRPNTKQGPKPKNGQTSRN